jgi:hypothetical protein
MPIGTSSPFFSFTTAMLPQGAGLGDWHAMHTSLLSYFHHHYRSSGFGIDITVTLSSHV